MSEKGTLLEALTSELLGDVLKLSQEIESLRQTLPSSSAEFTNQIQFQIGTLIRAKQDVLVSLDQIQGATKKICEDYAQRSMKSAADAANIDIKREAEKSVRLAIQSSFGESIAGMNEAAKNITIKADTAGRKFIEMKEEIRSDRINSLLKTAAVSIVCSLLVLFGAKLIGAFEHRPSDSEIQEIAIGRAILANWQNLPASDRQRISELVARPQK